MTFRKTSEYISKIATAAALALLCAGASVAAEKWTTATWDDDANEIAKFDVFCAERGMTSFDVLEANGYPAGTLPAKGEELLAPESKNYLLSTWMEAQSRGMGPKPLVTVKLHGVPSFMRDGPEETEPSVTVPPEPTETPPRPQAHEPESPAKGMRIIVSGDRIALEVPEKPQKTQKTEEPENALKDSVLFDPTIASRDIIISNPPVLVPLIGPPAGAETQGKMMWPVSGNITSGFGKRGKRSFHAGIDMPMPSGTPVAAALNGVVLETATSKDRRYRGYGNVVLIDHGSGIVTLYAHCSKINVNKGQKIKQGDIVALVGKTGRATAYHVHFEVRKNGSAVNPIPYLMPR